MIMNFTSQKRLELVNEIIADLKAGVPVWDCPWQSTLPSNFLTNKVYNGINVLILWRAAARHQWESSQFLTFKQVKRLKGCVNKGERGTRIFYFDLVDVLNDEGEVEHIRPVYQSSIVYNVAQTNLSFEPVTTVRECNHKDISVFINAMKSMKVGFYEGGDSAHYNPVRDCITLPTFGSFRSLGDYLATAWHEVIHATGHELRCARGFGTSSRHSPGYALEELVAEIGSKMLGAELGFQPGTYASHESYIQHYISLLENDYNMLFKAASLAQKAVNYIASTADLQAVAV